MIQLVLYLIIIYFHDTTGNIVKKTNQTVIGIHFGRQFIRMCVYDGANYNIIPNSIGESKTPIIISFNNHGEVLIGKKAKHSLNNTIILDNLPKLSGKTYNQIISMKQYPFNYQIINKFNKPYVLIKFRNFRLELTVEEILSHLFKYLKSNIEQYLNVKIKLATLSTPDEFTESQLLSIRAAANLGGFVIVESTKDSISAIYSYFLNEVEDDINVLSIDIGRDSTNLVVILCDKNGQEVIGKKYLDNFGFNKINEKLENYLLSAYESITESKLRNEKIYLELKRKVNNLINELIMFNSFEFDWNSVGVDLTGIVSITRAKFDEFIIEFIEELLEMVSGLLLYSELKRSDISEILIIGSSFSIWKLKQEIENYFYGHELRFENGLDEAVVFGISRMGFLNQETNQIYNIVLPDVLTYNLGIEVYGSIFRIIVPKFSVLPIKKFDYFTISFDNQKEIIINVLEGERSIAKRNKYLGKISFFRQPNGLRGISLFRVEIEVDSNGEIFVSVTDEESKINKYLLIKKDFQQMQEMDSSMPFDSNLSKKDYEIERAYQIRNDIESIAYELRAHFIKNSSFINKIYSPIDLKILKESSNEIIQWFERYSFSEITDLENLKMKFDTNVKLILLKTFSY